MPQVDKERSSVQKDQQNHNAGTMELLQQIVIGKEIQIL